MRLPHGLALPIAGLLFVTNAPAQQAESELPAIPEGYEKTAPLFANLGDHHHEITTDVPLAQRYFDQGLVLAMGFNHAEAARSFREAQKLDPDCAMAYWGEALVLGPNINAAMPEENVPEAWAALQKAREHADSATSRHQAYIEALSERYAPEHRSDRSDLDKAYADAMREVARSYPQDHDAQALFAEALMDTTPWDYWEADGEPKEITSELLRVLERTLARQPEHPLANHLYIHAVEAEYPQWGVAAAERIGDLVPDAGHLVHMPSHIYIRVGQYIDANKANEAAVEADNSYITQCHAQGVYALGYVPHNHHFLWFGKGMTGESADCLAAAQHVHDYVDQDKMREPGLGALQHFYTLPLQTYARFGMWDEALAADRPADDLLYPRGIWRFARGMAHARSGDTSAADTELEALSSLAAESALEDVRIWEGNSARSVLAIAETVLRATLAEEQGDLAEAERRFREAVQLEDDLKYDEPPTWFIPVRQYLGHALLEADRPAEAEKVYREDLAKYPDNGWSLLGLAQSLEQQGRSDEAAGARQRFQHAWRNADARLSSSRF